MINFHKFFTSLKIAISGLRTAFKEEQSFRIQILIGIIVILFMIALNLNPLEISILVLAILLVLGLELINSQIERFLDLIQPDHYPKVKIIKDISAAAVLVAALGTIIVGILILLPHLLDLFR